MKQPATSISDRPFRLRAAVPEDLPILLTMERQLAAEEGHPEAVLATEAAWRRDGFGPAARFAILVAEHEGEVIGMITYNDFYLTVTAGTAIHIQDLFVAPAHRHRGVARALLAGLAAEAVARRVPLVHLNVLENNPARALYLRTGFQHIRENLTYVLVGDALADLARAAETRGTSLP